MTSAPARIREHLATLCSVQPDRRPGSPGNQVAVDYCAGALRDCGWSVRTPEFPVVDWDGADGWAQADGQPVPVAVSPYALGADCSGRLTVVAREQDLERIGPGDVVLARDELTGAPLTPRNYPFYSSPDDTKLLSRLESSGAAVVLAVTGRHRDLAGSLDPFPWIEDGTFAVPTANVRPADADGLTAADGSEVTVQFAGTRYPATARNVVATKGTGAPRLLLVAHIDTKPGTPGALDNGAGVATLLELARMLQDVGREPAVEVLLVNGEDYYAASGEVAYLQESDLDAIGFVINLDGVGLRGGPAAYSTYGLPAAATGLVRSWAQQHHCLVPGPEWFQSDHAVFAQRGIPALALTSADFDRALGQVAHSPTDVPEVLDTDLLAEVAAALADLARRSPQGWATPASGSSGSQT